MSLVLEAMKEFVSYVEKLRGDEKGEAQVFCDRLFRAFGHGGYKEAGATLEQRIKRKGDSTKFADLVWADRALIEMKKRGTKLNLHYKQALDYWIHSVPHRPRYVVLCNFDEFWIYDFENQVDQPVDKVKIPELAKRYSAFNFLFPTPQKPVFRNDLVAVTRSAADKLGELFRSLVRRDMMLKVEEPVARKKAQRFILQCVVALFAEDMDLLPSGMVASLVDDCIDGHQSAFDLFGALFRQMNDPTPATGGRYQGVRYFNGGLFATVEPYELGFEPLNLLSQIASEDWSKVNPAIFGTLFQSTMDVEERHAHGAHFTSESDILRVVNPTIVRPWTERIEAARTLKELAELRNSLTRFRVLDPACGSGNFLYVSFRELARVEIQLLSKARELFSAREIDKEFKSTSLISPQQFYGIEQNSFGVELAKVTLMIAKKLAIDEALEIRREQQLEMLNLREDDALPLDNLDSNFICDDALFTEWPAADAVIGNPPFQSKNKMQSEFGREYIARLRKQYPDVPGRADYCVYWFRRAHDFILEGDRAGLVATNTIRQNYSREGSLDYVVGHGGTITEAVSSQVWSGDAVVHVAIVNWIKGKSSGTKRLMIQDGDSVDSPWRMIQTSKINSALSFDLDVTTAKPLRANSMKGKCYQGQTHGHKGFLLSPDDARALIRQDSTYEQVIFPYLIADDLVGTEDSRPSRYAIDFHPRDLIEASQFKAPFKRIQERVLPDRRAAYAKEAEENKLLKQKYPDAKPNQHHEQFYERWWQFDWPRAEMIRSIQRLPRYIVCGRVTKRPIFDFVSPKIRPNDALTVFPFADDYTFGILQSVIHWLWFINRCSTFKADPRYTSNTVFDSYPWPQSPSSSCIRKIAEASHNLRVERRRIVQSTRSSLRELYRTLELPGRDALKDLSSTLNSAVRDAYGMTDDDVPLEFLLELNKELDEREKQSKRICGPGVPPQFADAESLVSDDCIETSL